MKKKILSFMLAVAMACSMAVPVFAADSAFSANGAFAKVWEKVGDQDAAIDIIYNGDLLTYADANPENIDGRVMIPFRTVLETMGAEVTYDEKAGDVTAVRNDTTINFKLNGDTIDVDNAGEKSQVKMDVPMVVKNERTLMPVRFLSEAFGMNVGWDANTNTVLIVDMGTYLSNLETKAPNLYKLLQMETKMPTASTMAAAFKISFESNQKLVVSDLKTDTFAANIGLDLKAEYTYANEIANATGTMNLQLADLSKLLGIALKDGMTIPDLENVAFTIMYDKGMVYIKTDLLEKLAEKMPNEKTIVEASKFIDKNTWLKIDIKTIINDAYAQLGMESMFDTLISSMNGKTGLEVLEGMFAGEVTYQTAMSIDAAFDAYNTMDQYITVTDKGNGDYTSTIKMTAADFNDLIKALVGEEFAEIMASSGLEFIFDIDCTGSVTGDKGESKMVFSYGITITDENKEYTKIKMEMTASQEDSYTEIKDSDLAVPGTAIDISDLLKILEA